MIVCVYSQKILANTLYSSQYCVLLPTIPPVYEERGICL